MLPKSHFLLGVVAAIVLYFGFEIGILGCLVFLIATIGIDVDHYLYYAYRKKDWNLRKAATWFIEKGEVFMKMSKKKRSGIYSGFWFLHGIEVVVLTWLVGYFIWELFYFVSAGFLFHLILDWIHQLSWRGRLDKFSIVYDYFKYNKLKFIDDVNRIAKI